MKNSLQISTPSDREIVMTRVFDAPRELVFEAYTKPEYVKRWLGVFGGNEMVVCEIDLRVGGNYRYVWRGPNMPEMGMGGTYRTIQAPERLVATEKFDQAWYEGDAVGTVTFVEHAGKTTLAIAVQYASQAARDGVLKSPMDKGVSAGCDALEDVLVQLMAAKKATK